MSDTLFNVKKKVVVITGAAGGIGEVIACAFAKAGAHLALLDLPGKKLDALEASLKAQGSSVLALPAQVESLASCTSAIKQISDHFGSIDILVNGAGVNTRMRPELYSEEVWDHIIDVNLKGTFHMCQAAYPFMKAQAHGKIINIGSIMAIASNAVTPVYSASKAAVHQLTKSLACAWAQDGINVNVIHPGWIDTALSRQARIDIPGHAERVAATTPMGRWGEPEDLVGSILFLASAASDFVNGASLVVDGGVTAHI
ncbi:MAG: glucose 1-dehydrogenase [Burkholderiaceae bacterium]|nr:glucose 1-dehydrogenase [Burkholderiaceae bacterium]